MKKLLLAFLLMMAPIVFADDGPPYAPQENGYSLLTSGELTELLVGGGAGIVPVWTTATGSGAPVRATDPTLLGTLIIIPAATDPITIDIQGATNDYTGAGAGVTFNLTRDVNRGTGAAIPNYAGWQSYLNTKHTDAWLTGNRENYGAISRIDHQGRLTNTGAVDYQLFTVGAHNTNKMSSTTVFDTDSTGKLTLELTGTYGYAFGDSGWSITDTGGNAPANIVIASGVRGFVENDLTLAGGAAATVVSAALYADEVIGSTDGTSLGAGLYIKNGVAGSDTNYAIYSLETDPSYLAGALSIDGILTITPDGTNEVFQVNDGTIDFTDGNGGVAGVLTVSAGGDWSFNKDLALTNGSLEVDGPITGEVLPGWQTAEYTMTRAMQRGGAVMMTTAHDVNLLELLVGDSFKITVRDAAETVSVRPYAGDTLVYPGLALGASDELDSPGAAQDELICICYQDNTAYCNGTAGWTDGGAGD